MSDYELEPDYGVEQEDLSARLDRLEAAANNFASDGYGDDEIEVGYDTEGIDARQYLADVAEATRAAVHEAAGVNGNQAPPPRSSDEVIQQAQEIVAKAIPSWHDDEAQIVEYLTHNPVDLGPAIQTGDPGTVAQALLNMHTRMTLGDSARRTKQAAQTMTGSNLHTDAPTAWDEIKAARSGVPSFGP